MTEDEAREAGVSEAQVSEAQIAVHWREEEHYYPPAKFIGQVNASGPAILGRFREERFPVCFGEYADLLSWDSYWHTILGTSDPPFWKWFTGGRLNACYNCVDRHLAAGANQAALIWVPEPEAEATQAATCRELCQRVNEVAAMLRDFAGVKAGDRVTLHLPMVPELPVTMLACARLGAVHSQVFGGFSGVACGDRIAGSGSRTLVTMDGYYRSGELIDHKVKVGEAVEQARAEGTETGKVLVWRWHAGQYASQSPMADGRDFFADEIRADYRGAVGSPVSMPAEAPLFLMYSSGTAGRPKGCQHSTGGYLAYVAGTSDYYQDIHPGDTYWCAADIGWITGHSHIVYGPLALGTTSVMYEELPACPDAGRLWRIAEQLGVAIFHTAPVLQPMKPGSCDPGVLGIYPVVPDEHGDKVEAGSGRAGNMCIRNPWPGSFQTIWGQPDRYVAGHRSGTEELESAAIMVGEIAEAAAVPVLDELRGRAVEIYVSLKPEISPDKEIEDKVSSAIETEIGKIAKQQGNRLSSREPGET